MGGFILNTNFSMVAAHSKRPVNEDKIFGANREANKAAEKYGFENVINSTIGAFLDDNGKLLVLPSVMNTLRNLSDEEIAAYAPIAGLPEYLEAIKTATFRNCTPEGYIKAIATPGGSGAIRHAIWNYSEMGDYILTSDWYWGPYKTIANEHGRKITTYKLFDENDNFNIDSFREELQKLLKIQDRVVILLNSPAHNPTGFTLELNEWEMVIDTLKELSKDKNKKIILFSDVAYLDFAGETNESRRFMKLFGNLPENILTIIAFSMSKGYTLYGLRSGAMICVTSSKSVAEEFVNVGQFSNRGVWSNGTRCAMKVLAEIFNNKDLLAKVDSERLELRKMLEDRGKAFLESATRVGLKICPYKAGFFISVPCDNPDDIAKKLKEDNVFVVPLSKGIRFTPCSVSKEKCAKAPELILKALNK